MNSHANACPSYCPGCYFPKQEYGDVLRKKSERASLIFTKTGCVQEPILAAPPDVRIHYRRKVVMHTSFSNGRWHFGLMKDDAVLDIGNCAIHSQMINDCIAVLKRYLPQEESYPLRFYIQSGAQIALVFKSRHMPDMSWFGESCFEELRSAGAEGIWTHCNASAGKRIFLTDRPDLFMGKASSTDEDGLWYGPQSFTQQIPLLSNEAIRLAVRFFTEARISDTLIDLYSGTGKSYREFSRSGFHCLGVELSGEAVRMAALNRPPIPLLRGKCHQRIPQMEDFLEESKICDNRWNLYLNPPRTGLDDVLMEWVCRKKPARIAYLSCSPNTLTRDILLLQKQGYEVRLLQPFDFFPYTRHVETLALLTVS